MEDLSSHGIVALVRNSEGKFLLLEDSRDEMKGFWAPPHGRCEVGDKTEEEAVVREVFEETHFKVFPVKKVHSQSADTKVKSVSFWSVKTKSYDVRLNNESSNYCWVTLDEALQLKLYPGTKSFFEEVKKNNIKITD